MQDPMAAKVLAHEVAHLLGAEHDGEGNPQRKSFYGEAGRVPCPDGNLMAPSVGPDYNIWSQCTRNMIDMEDDKREDKRSNCFYT